MPIKNIFAETHPDITAWRRHMHQHPELGFDLHETARFVEEKLRSFGLEDVTTGVGQTGVVAVIKGKTDTKGRVIGLRADMDALPINEATGLEYASKTPGKMHACGHDGHTAMLLGAAQYLAETRNFDGTAVLIFHRDLPVDLRTATEAARAALQRDRDVIATLDDAAVRDLLAPLSSELLVNWYDEWLLVHQERWRQLRLHALDAISEVLTDLGRWALAVDAATASVDAEPLRESGYRCLMHAHLAQGNLSEVIRTHRQYRDLLHRELGVRPSHHMVELLDAAIG